MGKISTFEGIYPMGSRASFGTFPFSKMHNFCFRSMTILERNKRFFTPQQIMDPQKKERMNNGDFANPFGLCHIQMISDKYLHYVCTQIHSHAHNTKT